MNLNDALPDAVAVWRAPDDMVAQWNANEWKQNCEYTVADWCGQVETVADVGCGNGRHAYALEYTKGYWGYDTSQRMLELAERQKKWCPTATFTCVDVLAYQGSMQFDVVLFIDVAQHYADPIGAIKEMLARWDGTRYLISLVCGDQKECLSATTVVSYHSLLELWDPGTGMNLERMYMQRFDGLLSGSWTLLEVTR